MTPYADFNLMKFPGGLTTGKIAASASKKVLNAEFISAGISQSQPTGGASNTEEASAPSIAVGTTSRRLYE